MIDIVILSYNRLPYLKKTIQALSTRTTYPFRLIVVDNASTDNNLKKYLHQKQQQGIVHKLIFNPSNQVLGGWHPGLQEVASPFFAISDPDIIVPDVQPCWLTQLLALMEQFPRLVRIGLSLDPADVPPCWTRRQAKRLCFKTGPYFDSQKKLRLIDVDTTMQLIRTPPFIAAGGLEPRELNMDFWKTLHQYGVSTASQQLTARHLGWYEYREEPEYLKQKAKIIRSYPETSLIAK